MLLDRHPGDRYLVAMDEPLMDVKTLKRVGNAPSLDFVNTVHSHYDPDAYDYIPTYRALVEWAERAYLITRTARRQLSKQAARHPRLGAKTHRQAIALRGHLYRIFRAVARGKRPAPRDVKVLNKWLADVFARRKIVAKGKRFEWSTSDDKALDRPLWSVVLSAGELLVGGYHDRIKECPGDNCGWLFLDTSKNGQRKWCLMETCGNVAKARRFYDRHVRGAAR